MTAFHSKRGSSRPPRHPRRTPGSEAPSRLVLAPERLAAVRQSRLLDTPPEECFDAITRLAARLLEASAALVSIVDGDRDFFKSEVGLAPELARARQLQGQTFCHFTLDSEQPLVIDDSHAHPVWRAVPTVDVLGIRAYLGVPLRLDGQSIGSLCVIDVKARQWSDAEVELLVELARSLTREISLRAALRSAQSELEAFAYSLSHDLKNPLAAVDGFAHALEHRLQGKLDPTESRYLKDLRTSVQGMYELADAMLKLHKLLQQPQIQQVEVDVSQLAHQILAELAQAAPARRSRILIEPGVTVQGDPALLAVAFRNLLGNAWKFSARKEITDIRVLLDPAGPSGFATVSIRDGGAGFDPALASKLFAPFERLHHAADFPGTGIGLATVRRIVSRHGGSVRAEGVAGQGATFSVSLPLARPAAIR